MSEIPLLIPLVEPPVDEVVAEPQTSRDCGGGDSEHPDSHWERGNLAVALWQLHPNAELKHGEASGKAFEQEAGDTHQLKFAKAVVEAFLPLCRAVAQVFSEILPSSVLVFDGRRIDLLHLSVPCVQRLVRQYYSRQARSNKLALLRIDNGFFRCSNSLEKLIKHTLQLFHPFFSSFGNAKLKRFAGLSYFSNGK